MPASSNTGLSRGSCFTSAWMASSRSAWVLRWMVIFSFFVMAGLVPAIHVVVPCEQAGDGVLGGGWGVEVDVLLLLLGLGGVAPAHPRRRTLRTGWESQL